MGFSAFMASRTGRALRVIGGAAMVVIGVLLGGEWRTLTVVSRVPLLAGVHSISASSPGCFTSRRVGRLSGRPEE